MSGRCVGLGRLVNFGFEFVIYALSYPKPCPNDRVIEDDSISTSYITRSLFWNVFTFSHIRTSELCLKSKMSFSRYIRLEVPRVQTKAMAPQPKPTGWLSLISPITQNFV